MTQREQEILEMIKKEPTISQQDLADRLQITRSSVAVHITNLMKKGFILGKGYVVQDEPYVVVIGGANIDIQGFPNQKLIANDSNIGEVKISLGGVGRNIAENCARLSIQTRLMSAIGDDVYGQKMLQHAQSIGLHMSDCVIVPHQSTSTYLSILDEQRELAVAINHMDTMKYLTVEHIMSKRSIIEHALLCVLDANLTQEVLGYLLTQFPKTIFFVDTVSSTKALKIKPYLDKIFTIKPNAMEAEVLLDSNQPIRVQRCFVSLGSKGVKVYDSANELLFKIPPVTVVNATGAGDAFMAGLVYAYVKGMNLEKTVLAASAAARLALLHPDTINPQLNEESLQLTMKEIQPYV